MRLSTADIDKHVANQLRKRRVLLKITQAALGQQTGVTFSQIQKYERGTNRIGAGKLFLLATFLCVGVDYFYEGLPVNTLKSKSVPHHPV